MNAVETFQAQYPIALAAIAAHMQAHNLPAPFDIFTVDEVHNGRRGKAIRLHLPGRTHVPWLTSVEVDDEATEPAGDGARVRSEWSVRLPDTGIRVQLVGYHLSTTAVPA